MTTSPSSVQLICEGFCNPLRMFIDADIKRERYMAGTLLPATPESIKRLRALKHTAHVRTLSHRYRCTICNAERTW